MDNPQVSNPNDFKVVDFHNSTDFAFTPEMGCMFDGRPIFGISGLPGIQPGEIIKLPYHIGQRLATNLAKAVLMRSAPTVDQAGIPTGVPLWDETRLESIKNSFIKELYSESRPMNMTETDKLMAKVEELKKFVEENVSSKTDSSPVVESNTDIPTTESKTVFQDKQEVIAELEKRGISHDKRKSKSELEKLLA